jgi:hypothetical protein
MMRSKLYPKHNVSNTDDGDELTSQSAGSCSTLENTPGSNEDAVLLGYFEPRQSRLRDEKWEGRMNCISWLTLGYLYYNIKTESTVHQKNHRINSKEVQPNQGKINGRSPEALQGCSSYQKKRFVFRTIGPRNRGIEEGNW